MTSRSDDISDLAELVHDHHGCALCKHDVEEIEQLRAEIELLRAYIERCRAGAGLDRREGDPDE